MEFFLIYRLFCTPEQLLESLKARFSGPPETMFTDTSKYKRTVLALQRRY